MKMFLRTAVAAAAASLFAASLLGPAPAGRAQGPRLIVPGVDTNQADISDGQLAAETWLGRLDAGEYGRSWQEAAPYFQRATTEAKWTELLGTVRLPLGKPVSRRSVVGQFSSTMPGMPDGGYVFLQFQTQFERKQLAVETITCLRDTDNRWRVAGYFIK